ncbi:MAG TPA: hypothetical protein VE443_07000, partial [Beijerinckiaceae bacterium]|nr:hypothetical protein [Beijerinckiaceae bacterium]
TFENGQVTLVVVLPVKEAPRGRARRRPGGCQEPHQEGESGRDQRHGSEPERQAPERMRAAGGRGERPGSYGHATMARFAKFAP